LSDNKAERRGLLLEAANRIAFGQPCYVLASNQLKESQIGFGNYNHFQIEAVANHNLVIMNIPVEINTKAVEAQGIKFSLVEGQQEIARAYLYIMHNELHPEPFGLLEDVFVDESQRGKGLGTTLVKRIITVAKERGCYKLIATSRKSRPRVHQLYSRLGFQERGSEFRLDFPRSNF